jgi:Cys-tRNA(Pro)/Cys-tRNA(Cys) deacylase
MPIVNNITRLLDQRKISYRSFELPAEKLGARASARILGVDPEIVYKSIVAVRPTPGSKPVLAVIPGNHQLDLKTLAVVLGEKKVQVPTQREAERVTGLLAGGISPLALINKGFTILLDRSADKHAEIHISGGQRGLNIRLPVKDLLRLTGARLAPISIPSDIEDEEEGVA